MEKIPNWLRYGLAIPFGLICGILGYYIYYLGNLWVASPDSLMMKFCNFIYSNCIIILVIVYAMNTMLPKHQFKFTLVVTILYCALGLVSLGILIITQSITWKFIVQLIMVIATTIYTNIHVFNEYKVEE